MSIEKSKSGIIGSDRWTIKFDMEGITDTLLKEHVPEHLRIHAEVCYVLDEDGLISAEIVYDDFGSPEQQ